MNNILAAVGFESSRRLGGSTVIDEDNKTEAIVFTVIFYSLFIAMLIGFWFVFKKSK